MAVAALAAVIGLIGVGFVVKGALRHLTAHTKTPTVIPPLPPPTPKPSQPPLPGPTRDEVVTVSAGEARAGATRRLLDETSVTIPPNTIHDTVITVQPPTPTSPTTYVTVRIAKPWLTWGRAIAGLAASLLFAILISHRLY